MKPTLVAALIFLFSFGCGVIWAKKSEENTEAQSCQTTCQDGNCAYRDFVFQTYHDSTELPCENFYKHVCGKWTGPDVKTRLRIDTMDAVKKLLDTSYKSPEERTLSTGTTKEKQDATTKAKLVYQRCVKSAHKEEEKKTRTGIQNILKKYGIATWPEESATHTDKTLYRNILTASGLRAFATIMVISDLKDSPSYTVDLNHPRFEFVGIPSWNKTAKAADQYKTFIKSAMKFMKGSLEEETLTKLADEVYNFEQMLANEVPPPDKQGRLLKPIRKFRNEYNLELPLRDTLNADFSRTGSNLTNDDYISLRSLGYFKNITEVIKTEKPHVLKNYIGWYNIREIADVASPNFLKQLNELKAVTSRPPVPELNPDGCVRRLTGKHGLLDSVIAYLYLQKHDKSQAKPHIQPIASYLNSSFERMISANEWMNEKTKKRSKERIRDTVYKIGYNAVVMNQSYIENFYKFVNNIEDDVSFVEIYHSLLQNEFLQNLLRYSTPYDTSNIWRHSPLDTEGGYSDYLEDLEIPAAAFWFPVHNDTLPNAVNFGSMGSRMAEKLTHGFSQLAVLYRRDATMKRHLWSRSTKRNFEKFAECFKDAAQARPDDRLNGEGNEASEENSDEYYYDNDYGDDEETTEISNALKFLQHVGLRSAYNGFLEIINNCETAEATGTEGESPDIIQKKSFFTAYAMTYCVNSSSSTYLETENSVNFALKTYKKFWEAFDCKEGSSMRKKDTCKFMGDPVAADDEDDKDEKQDKP